jgi:primary-amine oxidase
MPHLKSSGVRVAVAGCDCLGHIQYFDALLNDSKGQPSVLKKAVCMHEEDYGLMW